MIVRLATPADAEAVARVHRESWISTYSGMLPRDFLETQIARRTPDNWRTHIARGGEMQAVWVAESEAGVVGFAACGPARHRLEGLEAEIHELYVVQQAQRQGAGRALVGECARHFVRHARFGFYLWVLKANRARLFYEALGGVEAGEKSERLGQHSFSQVAYTWHDIAAVVAPEPSSLPGVG